MRYTVQYRYLHKYGWRWAVCCSSKIIYHTAQKHTALEMVETANPVAPSTPVMLTQAMIDGIGEPRSPWWHNFIYKVRRAA